MSIRLIIIFLLVVLLLLAIHDHKRVLNKSKSEDIKIRSDSRTPPPSSPSPSLSVAYSSNSTVLLRIRDSWPDPPWPILPVLLSAKAEIIGDRNDSSHELDYSESCPKAEQIVRDVVKDLYRARPEVAPILLRLVFHDCFIEGCDTSVLRDSTQEMASEKDSPPNETLRGFDVIDTIKSKLEEECPGVVSFVLAARDSVSLSGGPYYPVYTGRRDSTLSFSDHAKTELPSPHDSLPVLLALFTSRGFSERELVSLLGTHSIGIIHCKFFGNRLYNFSGTNEPDPSLDTEFLQLMRTLCNHTITPNASAVADNSSPLIPLNYEGSVFGSQYFHSLFARRQRKLGNG